MQRRLGYVTRSNDSFSGNLATKGIDPGSTGQAKTQQGFIS